MIDTVLPDLLFHDNSHSNLNYAVKSGVNSVMCLVLLTGFIILQKFKMFLYLLYRNLVIFK